MADIAMASQGPRGPAQAVSLAVAGASRLIMREIDGNAHKALLDELAAEI
jgi:F0F1-type ATP synthase membrane subunit b/b'